VLHVNVFVYVCMCVSYEDVCVSCGMCVCACVNTYVCVYVYMCAYVYTWIQACVCVYTCISCTHMYVYTYVRA